MDKEKILKELREKFEEERKRLGFESTFEEINGVSYIEDMALSHGFVSNQFSRQLTNRMIETFYCWVGGLYTWTLSQAPDMVFGTENKKISEEERKEITQIIDKIMYFVRREKRVAFEGPLPKEEGKLVDDLVKFAKEEFEPIMFKLMKKHEETWKKEFSEDKNN